MILRNLASPLDTADYPISLLQRITPCLEPCHEVHGRHAAEQAETEGAENGERSFRQPNRSFERL